MRARRRVSALPPPAPQIAGVVHCVAYGPYGLIGTLEQFMAEAARKSLLEFLDFCKAYVAERLAAGDLPTAPQLALPAPPQAAAAATAAAQAAAAEEFYDAEEAVEAGAGWSLAAPSQPMGFEEAALLYMRYMCKTGDEQLEALQAVHHQLLVMREELAALRHAGLWQQLAARVGTRRAALAGAALACSAGLLLLWGRRR